ncbi:Glycosyl transferase family 2 [Roseivivax halotolerans]|uniref:Glycosyl transferase family 2 n=1 Tax=Roseivivax halotolerans TaxID=93684 RepID=A0A1I5XRD2_9RHOB|nr:glycosyltransferase family 2 protein [Roseivivax halotolerans]SFQ34509.1 Glycosyl transferase family 2 [Roseivivax halotolerans]
MSKDTGKRPAYPGGIDAVLTQMEGRRDPITYAEGQALPPVDIDLAPLKATRISPPAEDPSEAPPFRSAYHRKRFALREEFTGASELACLHGLLIAHLRKRSWPNHAPALFRRLWAEEAEFLLAALDLRWQVSAVTTFGDHGATPEERASGLALSTLFGAMKLYETERLYSGRKPDAAFALDDKVKSKLPMQMDSYSILHGGLDVNMLGRLWQEAEAAPVIRPLAQHLIGALIDDPATIFQRLATMKARKQKREDGAKPEKKKPVNMAPVPARAARLTAGTLRWGVVATIKAETEAALRFAAHHLELGAHAMHIFLDVPQPETAAALSRDPRIRVITCDTAYWDGLGKPRMEAHQLRQVWNATRTLQTEADRLDWLAHIDVDEFLLPDRPIAEILADVTPSAALARITPVEALAPDDGSLPSAFKLTHAAAGTRKAEVQDIYPTFGMHLYGGFLSHTTGKVFARTGIPETRFGIHALKHRGAEVTNKVTLSDVILAHLHAPDWQTFLRHLDFRRTRGSYAKQSERPGRLGVADILGMLQDEDGEAGLRTFFDEICRDTPELRAKLAAHGMLKLHPLDLDGAVARVFRGRAA